MPKHGISFREALQNVGAFEQGHGTVYYNGEDGNRAIYDVTGMTEGAIIINGSHSDVDGKLAVSTTLPGAVHYFEERNISIEKGWNVCP